MQNAGMEIPAFYILGVQLTSRSAAAFARRDRAEAGIAGFAGIRECLEPTATLAADRAIFAGAHAAAIFRTVRSTGTIRPRGAIPIRAVRP